REGHDHSTAIRTTVCPVIQHPSQESSVTTQSEDNDVNVKVLQSKNSDGNKRVYDCPVCRKQFGVPSELKRHLLQSKNHNGSKRVYECPVCHKWFGAPSELKRHCLIHTNQRPFQCSICCRAFRERSHLKVHMKTHNVPVKRRTPSLQSCRDNRVSCNRASKSELKPSLKYLTAHNDTTLTNKQTLMMKLTNRQSDQSPQISVTQRRGLEKLIVERMVGSP
uniref:C2H2-type domain-containing protein n=1 Tax=Cyprinus carpio TaxID=7962 RepID=A0A8C1X207_CYPCA